MKPINFVEKLMESMREANEADEVDTGAAIEPRFIRAGAAAIRFIGFCHRFHYISGYND